MISRITMISKIFMISRITMITENMQKICKFNQYILQFAECKLRVFTLGSEKLERQANAVLFTDSA